MAEMLHKHRLSDRISELVLGPNPDSSPGLFAPDLGLFPAQPWISTLNKDGIQGQKVILTRNPTEIWGPSAKHWLKQLLGDQPQDKPVCTSLNPCFLHTVEAQKRIALSNGHTSSQGRCFSIIIGGRTQGYQKSRLRITWRRDLSIIIFLTQKDLWSILCNRESKES